MGFFLEDVRYGLRGMAKNPGFTVLAVTALALGIGTNAAVFTLANGVLFKSMPFDRNDRILYLSTKNQNRGDRISGVSYPDFRDWRDQAEILRRARRLRGPRRQLQRSRPAFRTPISASEMTVNSFSTPSVNSRLPGAISPSTMENRAPRRSRS